MKKYMQMMRKLGIGLIVISLGLTLVPLAGSFPIEKEAPLLMNRSDGIVISGTMGENGWYISSVCISFKFSGETNHTYWKLDDGMWMEYITPLLIVAEGEHMVWVLIYTQEGNVTFNASFKIDMTKPDTSVVWSGNHNVIAFVYDVAGNSEADNLSTSYALSTVQSTMAPEDAARYQAHYLLFWKIRGEIKDYEMSDNHWYHLNVTRMVSTSFALIFPLPFVPIPLFGRSVSRDQELWLVWGEDHLFNKEEITGDSIDFFCIDYGELYPE